MKIVSDWKEAWRWFSVQAMAAALAMQAGWAAMPADLKSSIPAGVVDALAVALLVLGIVGRLVDQGRK